MEHSPSDALVFFGAKGDLAYKKIFPSLHAMVKRGNLNVPVIGVARAGWSLDQLRARVRESVERHGEFDPAVFDKLSSLLRCVEGDYQDLATFQAIRSELQGWDKQHIFLLWFSLMVITAAWAGGGFLLADTIGRTWLSFAEGVAAAAMIPEAVHMGKANPVGLSTLAGFLGAISFKLLE